MGWFKHDCEKQGHNYEARFDEFLPPAVLQRITSASGDAVEALRTKQYVKDICTKCGKEIKR